MWALKTDPFAAPELLPEFIALLSDDERKRAGRFRLQALTERHIISHAMVRRVLGNYLGIAPEDVMIVVDRLGRPQLPDYPEFDFNLSHTHGISVVAVARGTVGVDVERLRDDINVTSVASRVLNARECASVSGRVPASQTIFFDYWTLKEAYAKAVGLGVRLPFEKMDILLGSQMTVTLDRIGDDGKDWTFELYGLGEYRMAIAVKDKQNEHAATRFFQMNSALEPDGPMATTLLGTTGTGQPGQ